MNNYLETQKFLKNQSIPYNLLNPATNIAIAGIDTFPYNKFFRGVYNSSIPIIFDRQAGYYPITKTSKCQPTKQPTPPVCFQYACSTITPCYDTTPKKPCCIPIQP